MREEHGIELDIDGELGNGPDDILLLQDDTLVVGVWCTGSTGSIFFARVDLSPDGCLDLVGYSFEAPTPFVGFLLNPPPLPPCFSGYIVNFSTVGVVPSFRFGSLKYVADQGGPCLGSFELGEFSGWANDPEGTDSSWTSFTTLNYEVVGPTNTNRSNWLSLKDMFR